MKGPPRTLLGKLECDAATNQALTAKSTTTEPLAHVTEDGRPHLLRKHLEEVARLARANAAKFAPDAAHLAGLWHDLGKYSGDFQKMIREENGFASHIEAEGLARDHSTAGAIHAKRALSDSRAVPLSFVIAGHHAGLPDAVDLRERLDEKSAHYEAVLARAPPDDILSQRADLMPGWFTGTEKTAFELWMRMLFSALVDADFLDTEAFYSTEKAADRERPQPTITDLEAQLASFLADVEAMAPVTPVNLVRREVRRACTSAAAMPAGVFNLTVPTGGGKTLAAMAFALAHARQHGKRRVVVVIPFTSIIEQNAAVYRRACGESAVIEHHSALDPVRESPLNRIASENWDAPIIVTTTVQLFESLLANRTSSCRKLHNLVDSVIVLDEAQALPGKLLPPILDVMAELVRHYGVSLVVSTATQPAFGKSQRLREGLVGVTEICPPEMRLFDRLKRVRVEWPANDQATPYARWADDVATESAILAVVHLRKDARELCCLVDDRLGDESTVHLSALMTPAHRSRVLADVTAKRKRGEPVRIVSTQLVEAGVDLDFPIVLRAFGGFDSLAQAAGRCNREGLLPEGVLRVLIAETNPPRGVPAIGRDVALSMWRELGGEVDLFAPELQRSYFERLYEATSLKEGAEIQKMREELKFKSVADGFSLIADGWTAPLCIPHDDEGARRVRNLRSEGPSRGRLRALQRYTINVPKTALEKWVKQGVVTRVHDVVATLEGGVLAAYHDRFGLEPDKVGQIDPEELIG